MWPPAWLHPAQTPPKVSEVEPTPTPPVPESERLALAPAMPVWAALPPRTPEPQQSATVVVPPEITGQQCPRCRGREFVDVSIHGGQSVRRDCARCNRFIEFPVWYGQKIQKAQ